MTQRHMTNALLGAPGFGASLAARTVLSATNAWLLSLPNFVLTQIAHLWMDWADLVGLMPGVHLERLTGSADACKAADDAWRARSRELYGYLLTLGDARDGNECRAAEWMAVNSSYPRLLCDLLVCFGYDFEIRNGACSDSRSRPARLLTRSLLQPGAVYDLARWLGRMHLPRALPAEWADVFPIAPSAKHGAWVATTTWQGTAELEVWASVGGFETEGDALAFGDPSSLIRIGRDLVLASKARAPQRLFDDNLRVLQLRPEARGCLSRHDADFAPVNLPLSDYERHGLGDSFGSLSFGARRAPPKERRLSRPVSRGQSLPAMKGNP